MDAKGVLGSEACAPEELGMLTGSSGPGNLGSLGNLGGSSAHELFSGWASTSPECSAHVSSWVFGCLLGGS